MDIAWIGTGIMGAPMARRLLRAGHRVHVFNRDPAKARALAADGAIVAGSAADAAAAAEAVFIMVSDTPDVEGVIDKIEPVVKRGHLIVDMSTIAPAAERKIAARLAPRGADYLDAPVSGGDTGAIEGTLAIMVGGDPAVYERAMPLFNEMGKRIALMGPVGAGQMAKLANQIAVAVTLEAACEALTFARVGGLDTPRVLEAIGAGAAGSWQLNNLGPRIIERDYRPGFFLRLMRKDLRLINEAATELGLAMPGLTLAISMFNAAAALGHDEDGTQALADAVDKVSIVK